MRRPVDRERLLALFRALGRTRAHGRIYVTGGATAVLLGWRPSTMAVDLTIEGDEDVVLRAIPELKEVLEINVELAAPHHFLPEVPGWHERSRYVGREADLEFYHYDLISQALAKIERGHRQDLADVGEMLARAEVAGAAIWRAFHAIAPALYRYPAVDPLRLRRQLEATLGAETA